jgi:hypothetical protein
MISFFVSWCLMPVVYFFFNDTATTEIYTASSPRSRMRAATWRATEIGLTAPSA